MPVILSFLFIMLFTWPISSKRSIFVQSGSNSAEFVLRARIPPEFVLRARIWPEFYIGPDFRPNSFSGPKYKNRARCPPEFVLRARFLLAMPDFWGSPKKGILNASDSPDGGNPNFCEVFLWRLQITPRWRCGSLSPLFGPLCCHLS